ncbi:MAG: DMT family transporter, partial [Deltaproteobacteria bacterium]
MSRTVALYLTRRWCKTGRAIGVELRKYENGEGTRMEKLTLILVAFAAGMANAFQSPINAALGKYTGAVQSSCIS